MSTRCQIQFIEGKDKTQVYKHSDGYPDGILPLLKELKDELDKTRMYRGVDYLASQFIFFDKVSTYNAYRDDESMNDRGYHFLGHGVEKPNGKIHGDEEYLYRVHISNNGATWNVRIANKFTDFKDANWSKFKTRVI